jgi:hypothetical protein
MSAAAGVPAVAGSGGEQGFRVLKHRSFRLAGDFVYTFTKFSRSFPAIHPSDLGR